MVAHNTFGEILNVECNLSLPSLKDNQLEISFRESDEISTVFNGNQPVLPFAASEVLLANISSGRRLTEEDKACKVVYEVTFDITGCNLAFKPGDTIGIIPSNRQSEVDQILEHLKLSPQAGLEYSLKVIDDLKGKRTKIPPHIPVKSTLRHALTHCCDIRSVLKKLFILALSKHTKNENEKRILEYLCSKEGSAAYNTHILEKHFSILDLFTIFESCKPPIEVLLANLPRLLPRPYSIANSGLADQNLLKICFSVTELDNNRKGLVTGWLENILEQNNGLEHQMRSLNIKENPSISDRIKVPIYLRKNMSGFSLPEDLDIPLILVSSGTGVSPFIGFLEERDLLKKKSLKNKSQSEIWLFFGCRNPNLDFLYKEKLYEYLNNGTLNQLRTSFSRVENSDQKYIQDSIMQNGADVVKLLNRGAAIFVCGDVNKMAAQVREAFVHCLVKHDGKSRQEAETVLSDMQTGKRYLVDSWS